MFTPHRATYGDYDAATASMTERAELWFADRNGAAGIILLTVTNDHELTDVCTFVKLSAPPVITGRSAKAGPLTLTFGGDISSLEGARGTNGTALPVIVAALKNTGARVYRMGETFSAQITVAYDGSTPWTIEQAQRGLTLVSAGDTSRIRTRCTGV